MWMLMKWGGKYHVSKSRAWSLIGKLMFLLHNINPILAPRKPTVLSNIIHCAFYLSYLSGLQARFLEAAAAYKKKIGFNGNTLEFPASWTIVK